MSRTRMFRDDEPGTPSPRTTIVGGRPPESPAALPPVPIGIQTLLRLAALDASFRDQLLERRGAVAEAAGVSLTRSEQAILAVVPADQLGRMIDTLPAPPSDRRTFLRAAAASAVVLLGGVAAAGSAGCERACERVGVTAGVAPDPPPARPDHGFPAPGGAAPDPPPRPTSREMETEGGAAPDEPPPRPPDPPEPPEPPDADAAPPEPPDVGEPPRPQPTRGIRPDLPPPRPPQPLPPPAGARPDPPPLKPAEGGAPDPFPGSR
jgi:hypothetical protein